MPEVNLTSLVDSGMMEGSGGSGEGSDLMPFSSDVTTLRAGEVYAYRHNETFVVLGTRKREVFGTAIGIGVASMGQYTCVATNERVNKSRTVSIRVESKLFGGVLLQ